MPEMELPIGPQHPALKEPVNFRVIVDGERIVRLDLDISYNHRGVEKLNESKTYDQVPFVVERICGICSASHPLAYIQAVEEIAGVEVPQRAQYLRTIVNELERIHSHLLWVGLAGHFLGYNTVFMWAWKYREPILDALEVATGSRVNYANAKIGGSRRDMTAEQLKAVDRILADTVGPTEMLTGAVMDDPVLHARLKKVGVLTHAMALSYGAVGPTARASGVDVDVRRSHRGNEAHGRRQSLVDVPADLLGFAAQHRMLDDHNFTHCHYCSLLLSSGARW